MTDTLLYTFIITLAVVAFLYSSVGHGGASGYLAVMVLFGIAASLMRPAALIMNIVVSFTAFVHFYKEGHFRWKMFILFAAASIPAAYLGANILLPENIYKKILALILIVPLIKLVFPSGKNEKTIERPGTIISLTIGAFIGLLSGMMGIGGGIILSPLLLFFSWADMKETAALSAGFILVNSIAGIFAITTNLSFNISVIYWCIAVLAGALIGGFLGAQKFNSLFMKRILAVVLFIAVIKLLIT